MSRRVLILDTSVLCCWLQVPGKEEAGPEHDRWNHARISQLLEEEQKLRSTLVLPLATLIETGNHIAQAADRRFERAQALAALPSRGCERTVPLGSIHRSDRALANREPPPPCR